MGSGDEWRWRLMDVIVVDVAAMQLHNHWCRKTL
jgi:hypothetical protein